jgi:hypothetical protein
MASNDNNNNNVTSMPIARQRLGEHILEVTISAIEGHPLLDNGQINTNFLQ